jgi:hypothetical protein
MTRKSEVIGQDCSLLLVAFMQQVVVLLGCAMI